MDSFYILFSVAPVVFLAAFILDLFFDRKI